MYINQSCHLCHAQTSSMDPTRMSSAAPSWAACKAKALPIPWLAPVISDDCRNPFISTSNLFKHDTRWYNMIHASFMDHSCIISSKCHKIPLSYRSFSDFFTIAFHVLLFRCRCRCQEVKVPKCFCHAARHVFAANLAVSGPTARQRSQCGAVARVGGVPSETRWKNRRFESWNLVVFLCRVSFFKLCWYLWS